MEEAMPCCPLKHLNATFSPGRISEQEEAATANLVAASSFAQSRQNNDAA